MRALHALWLAGVILTCASAPPAAEAGPPASDTWRRGHPHGYLSAVGDFNGDGVRDSAWVDFGARGDNAALWVKLSSGPGRFTVSCLDSGVTGAMAQEMGVRSVRPGHYQTACGKGYFDCDSTETPWITTTCASIGWFKNEGAESFWVWDRHRGALRMVGISD